MKTPWSAKLLTGVFRPSSSVRRPLSRWPRRPKLSKTIKCRKGIHRMDPKLKATISVRENLENFFFVLPAVSIFCVFYIYPFINMFFLSFHEWRGIGPMHFTGLRNYHELMGDKLW